MKFVHKPDGLHIKLTWRERFRYFNTGVYDMEKILGIENRLTTVGTDFYPFTDTSYWDCNDWYDERNYCFSDETSAGKIFINDSSHNDVSENCKLELNCGYLSRMYINDTSGNMNKGILIGDYKIKKTQKGRPMGRDSIIKVPKKTDNKEGAL